MKKTVYCVLTGEHQKYFTAIENANFFMQSNPGSDIFTEDIEPEAFEKFAKDGLFEDFEEEASNEEKTETQVLIVDKKTKKDDLILQIEALHAENLRLKQIPTLPNKIDFRTAVKVYKRKIEAMKEIETYERMLQDLQNVNMRADLYDKLETSNFQIVFRTGAAGTVQTDILKISNIEVLAEVHEIMLNKVKAKIKAITDEVEAVNFI